MVERACFVPALLKRQSIRGGVEHRPPGLVGYELGQYEGNLLVVALNSSIKLLSVTGRPRLSLRSMAAPARYTPRQRASADSTPSRHLVAFRREPDNFLQSSTLMAFARRTAGG